MPARTLPFRKSSILLRQRAAGWWLLVLLVLAPWLGNLHAVLHPVAPPGGWIAQHHAAADASGRPAGDADATPVQAGRPHGLQRLFGSHDAGDCRVYDQLLHADALPHAPPPVVAAVWKAIRFVAPPQPQRSCGSAVFEARAPPPTR
ncbi:hypothetical protein ACFX58_04595 [Sphingomonas sp. NCPPB 2930]